MRPTTANHPELQRAVNGIVARKPQDGTIACKHEGTGIGDVEGTVKTTLLLETANAPFRTEYRNWRSPANLRGDFGMMMFSCNRAECSQLD